MKMGKVFRFAFFTGGVFALVGVLNSTAHASTFPNFPEFGGETRFITQIAMRNPNSIYQQNLIPLAPIRVANLNSALIPTFGSITPTADGFTFSVTNFDPNFTWNVVASNSGRVNIDGTGLVTVSGLAPATSSSVTVTATQTGFTDGSAVLTSMSALPATGTTTLNCPGGGTYSVLMPAGIVTANSSCAGNLIVNQQVNIINDNAFRNDTLLTGVTLPASTTYIGATAFWNTSLVNVTLPPAVTSIGLGAFGGDNYLTTVILGSGTLSLGAECFGADPVLSSVTLNAGLTTISDIAFFTDPSLHSIVIPDSVTTMGISVFANSGLTSANWPSGLTNIPANTFSQDHLTNFTIPSGVQTIGSYAFYQNALTNMTIPAVSER
jgi:hypothetical protein